MIHVVSGVAIDGGLVLMGKRKPSGLRPELWELPGGKVDRVISVGGVISFSPFPLESPRFALAREWMEELGVEIASVTPEISNFTIDLEDWLSVSLYEVVFTGDLKPLDHTELRWVTPLFAVKHLPCSPGFYLHYADLRRYMQRTGRWSES